MLKVNITQDDISKLLTTPKETYIINVETSKEALLSISNKLIPIEGLYLHNSYKPLIEFNANYYVIKENKYKVITSIDDIKTTKSNIYFKTNGVYELVYIYDKLKKSMSRLTITPKVNYSHILVLKEIIDSIISNFLYYRIYSSHYRLYSCFRDEHKDFVKDEEYLTVFKDLTADICDFVYEDRWAIYFTKIINNSILIEKTVDYRIYQWTLAQVESKENEDE